MLFCQNVFNRVHAYHYKLVIIIKKIIYFNTVSCLFKSKRKQIFTTSKPNVSLCQIRYTYGFKLGNVR